MLNDFSRFSMLAVDFVARMAHARDRNRQLTADSSGEVAARAFAGRPGVQCSCINCRFCPGGPCGDAAPRGALTFVSTPVDATACDPSQLVADSGNAAAKPIVCRTMFLSFHHMTPSLATAILADAVAKQDMIAVFELQHRAPLTLLINLFMLFLLPYVALLTRKVGWEFSRVFFTLVVWCPSFRSWSRSTASSRRCAPTRTTRCAR